MTVRPSVSRVFGIVPAAGLGRRMGRPKQTLPYQGRTILGQVARTLLDAGLDRVVVVTRSELLADLDLPRDERLQIAINDDAASHMIDSIRIGLSTLFEARTVARADHEPTDADGVLVVPGDMPGLQGASCRLCVAAFREDPTRIVVATHAGSRGHPLIFPAALRAEVMALPEGLNGLAARHPELLRAVETGDPGAVVDVDTCEDYRALTARSPD